MAHFCDKGPTVREVQSQFVYFQLKPASVVLTNLLTPWDGVLLEELIVTELVKKFPAPYTARRLTTLFTRSPTDPHPQPDESS